MFLLIRDDIYSLCNDRSEYNYKIVTQEKIMIYNEYFTKYRDGILMPNGKIDNNKIIYADWAASGRFYKPLEDEFLTKYAPYYANVHTEDSFLGKTTTNMYLEGKTKIKNHFGANNYSIIASGAGMTSSIHKLQQILSQSFDGKKVVFISEYEHNSNFISWVHQGYQCEIVDCVKGMPDYKEMKEKLNKYYKNGYQIIGSFSAGSNLTGNMTNIETISRIIKSFDGTMCVDYTAVAPHKKIDMEKLNIDALMFSPHKLLGGIGTSGILIINPEIYRTEIPSVCGGGVVKWVCKSGNVAFADDIETREEAGTPAITQVIKSGLAIDLLNEMGIAKIMAREQEIVRKLYRDLGKDKNIIIYGNDKVEKMPFVAFNSINKDYATITKELSNNYGIQARGGCSCASIYAHKLLKISPIESKKMCNIMKSSGAVNPYGMVRISLSALTSDKEIQYILEAIKASVQKNEKKQSYFRV